MNVEFKKLKDLVWVAQICNGDIFTKKFEKEFKLNFPELVIAFKADYKKSKGANWFEKDQVIIKFSNESDEAAFILKIASVDFTLPFEKSSPSGMFKQPIQHNDYLKASLEELSDLVMENI
jgi:hypothetical protein